MTDNLPQDPVHNDAVHGGDPCPDDGGFGPVTVITPEGSTEGYLMPDDSIKVEHRHPDYEALGIFPDTWACINVSSEKDARDYIFELMASGVDCRIARDPDGKRWHIAVKGGLADSPMAWLVGIRGRFEDSIKTCTGPVGSQHPMTTDPPLGGIEQYQDEDR